MTDNINAKPLVIPEAPVEERSEYISDARMYNEEELAFIRTRDEIAERTAAGLDELSKRLDESLARDEEVIAELDALIKRLESRQNTK